MGTEQFKDNTTIDSGQILSSPILIVDDEEANLKLLEKILSTEGYTDITCIESSSSVLALYRENRPSLILLDINMPDLSGFELVELLKKERHVKLPPIAFITGMDSVHSRAKAFEQGVLDYISKPFNRVELLSRVKNLLALDLAYQQLETRNQSLEEMVNHRTRELWESKLEIIQRLGRAAEYRDNETGAHIFRMSNTCAMIAKAMGSNEEYSLRILYASPMHDIGKIAIPDHILLKDGGLEPEEWEIMKSHTTLGAKILHGGSSSLMKMAAEIALTHHEKWNGSGYPQGLSGEDIPVASRIVAVADVFDALLSQRPYKESWSVEEAKEFINERSGRYFDPQVVDGFNKVFTDILEIRNLYVDSDQDGDEFAATDISGEKQLAGYKLLIEGF